MSGSETARLDLYNRLNQLLGPEHAETLMTYLPSFSPDQVATGSDLEEVRTEISDLRLELRREIQALRTDMRQLGTELRAEMAQFRTELRTELRGEMAQFRTEMRAELGGGLAAVNKRLDRLFLALLAGMFTVVAAMAGVLFAVA